MCDFIVASTFNACTYSYFELTDPFEKNLINIIFEAHPDVTKYKENGYVSLGKIINADQIQFIQDFAEQEAKFTFTFNYNSDSISKSILHYIDGNKMDRIENFITGNQKFRDMFLSNSIQNLIARYFEVAVTLFKDKLNYKPPGKERFPAHHDAAAEWEKWGPKHITLAVCIDPVSFVNGMLEFVDGYHSKGLLSEKKNPLSDDLVSKLKWNYVPMEPGEAIVFSSFAPHRSGPNLTNNYRRMLFITYGPASCGEQSQEFFKEKRMKQPPHEDWIPGIKYTHDAFGKYIPSVINNNNNK